MEIDHEWEDLPLSGIENHTYNISTSRACPNATKNEITIKATFNYTIDVESLRRCKKCGQESVNGEVPRYSCGVAQVKRVMEE